MALEWHCDPYEMEVTAFQRTLIGAEAAVTMKFGPLTASLGDLFADGWLLFMHERQRFCAGALSRARIHLMRGRTVYAAGSAPISYIKDADSLAAFVRQRNPSPQEMKMPDPFSVILAAYPRKPAPMPMIGNRTARDFILDEIRSAS